MRGYLARAFAGIAAMALAGTAHAACRLEQHGELPVTMDGLSPRVSARINGVDASFIVDSGAFFSLISPGVAGAAGLKLIKAPPGFWIVGIGGPMDASYATVKDLSIARMTTTSSSSSLGRTRA